MAKTKPTLDPMVLKPLRGLEREVKGLKARLAVVEGDVAALKAYVHHVADPETPSDIADEDPVL